jgi:hypothetical protein
MTATIRDPIAALLAECGRFAQVVEASPNRGVEIDYWIREAGLDPAGRFPWCMAFVSQVGRQALGAAWPLPRLAGVQLMVDTAKKAGLEPVEAAAVGDLLVVWHEEIKRYGHVGIVAEVAGGTFRSWEGNSNDNGSREGTRVLLQKARRPGPRFKFVRWVTLLEVAA